jgi:hypothetical protein
VRPWLARVGTGAPGAANGPARRAQAAVAQDATPPSPPLRKRLRAGIDGFSLQAAVHTGAHDCKRREKLSRHITGSAVLDEWPCATPPDSPGASSRDLGKTCAYTWGTCRGS